MEEHKIENSSETKQTTSNNKSIIIFVVIIVVVAAIIYFALTSGDGGSSINYLTYANYTKIQNGMSYSEVVSILGNHEGTLDTSAGYGGYTLSYYSWSNSSGTRCIVVGFENGKVCAKSQYGLT